MRLSEQRCCVAVVLLLTGALTLNASTTTMESRPTPLKSSIRAQDHDSDIPMIESLRKDVASHPDDFIIFETETSANQFIVGHNDVYRETEPRVILRGIVGYYQGKTLVILPSLSTATPW